MTRKDLIDWLNDNNEETGETRRIAHYLDDALAVHTEPYPITDKVRLVAFQCGFEPLVVAVRSYLDVSLSADEALEIAEDYLKEIGWLTLDDDGNNAMETYVL